MDNDTIYALTWSVCALAMIGSGLYAICRRLRCEADGRRAQMDIDARPAAPDAPRAPSGGERETGRAGPTAPDVVRNAFADLLSAGYTGHEAREAIDRTVAGNEAFESVAALIEAIRNDRLGSPAAGQAASDEPELPPYHPFLRAAIESPVGSIIGGDEIAAAPGGEEAARGR